MKFLKILFSQAVSPSLVLSFSFLLTASTTTAQPFLEVRAETGTQVSISYASIEAFSLGDNTVDIYTNSLQISLVPQLDYENLNNTKILYKATQFLLNGSDTLDPDFQKSRVDLYELATDAELDNGTREAFAAIIQAKDLSLSCDSITIRALE